MRVAILSRPDDAPGYEVGISLQLQVLMPDIQILGDRTGKADLVLVLIGPSWSQSAPDTGTVRSLQKALATTAKVVPVLVMNGRLPSPELLPESIRSFVLRSATELRHANFEEDLERVLKEVHAGNSGPWTVERVSGTLHIVSKDPGTLRRMIGKWDGGTPVNVEVDDAIVGHMRLFGDEMSFTVAPGMHKVHLYTQFEKPVEVMVPAGGTTKLNVVRNIFTGWVKITPQAS